MLGLTTQDIIGIQQALDPTARVKTLALDLVNGIGHINAAVSAAAAEATTAERAASLAVDIQVTQAFTNCNTRTATMCVFALLAIERNQWLRRKPYQVYGQVGHWGPIGGAAAKASLAQFISANMIGTSDIIGRWNAVMAQLPGVAAQVTAWKAQLPVVSKELRSWRNNHGY